MRAEVLIFSGTHARAESSPAAVPRVRVVESCADLLPGEYLWGVGRMTDPDTLSPLRRQLFLLQRQKWGVPEGKLPNTRGHLWTFERGLEACVDEFDYLYREPLDALLPAGKGRRPEDFVRPKWREHAALVAEMRARFAHEAEALRERGIAVRPPPSELADSAVETAQELVRVLERGG